MSRPLRSSRRSRRRPRPGPAAAPRGTGRRDGASRRALLRRRGADGDAAFLQLLSGAPAELVVAERGEELDGAVEVRELCGHYGPAAGCLLPDLQSVDDVARLGHVLDADELHPLHVTDD